MKKNIILLVTLFSSLLASAQVTHEISIQGGIGYATLHYKPEAGKHGGGFGGDLGLGYTCIFAEQWGFHIGVTPAFYNAVAKMEGATVITPDLIDNEKDAFDMHTTFNGFKERQNAYYLNLPIMAHFQTKTKNQFYALAGVKIGIHLKGDYKTKDGAFVNRGYYPKYENFLDSQEFAGFGPFTRNTAGKLSFKTTVMLAFEAGMKWKSKGKHFVYTGLYFDYGLTNISKNIEEHPFVHYYAFENEPAEITTTCLLPIITKKVNLIAIGFKLRLAFPTR